MIRLAKNLQLPLAVVTEVLAFLGKRGGGKTYGAMKLAEEILFAKAQLIAFDVVGKWYGLRIPKDKRNAPFDIVIFGGLHGDVEINPKAGKIVAQAVLTKNLSAVLDISQFIHSEQVRFMYDFLVELFEYRKKHPAACHIVFEEAQELIPQNLPPKEGENYAARLLSIGNRVVKLGRNYGIGVTLIAQRPQEVNKKVLNMAEILFAYQMVGSQEKDTVKEWTQSKGDDTDVKDLLPRLKNGEALVFSPAYLEASGIYKVDEKITADVSATPKVGVDATQAQKLEPRDVRELTESISALTVELEANTPAALKKKIAELEKDLARERKAIPLTVADVIKETVEVPVFPLEAAELIDNICKDLATLHSDIESLTNRFAENHDKLRSALTRLKTLPESVERALPSQKTIPKAIGTPVNKGLQSGPDFGAAQNSSSNEVAKHAQAVGNAGISRPQQKLLDTLALFESFGVTNVKRSNLAAFAGVSPRSSGFEKNLSTLRNHPDGALVDYLPGSHVALTSLGRFFTGEPETQIAENADLLDAWCKQISNPQSVLLRDLFAIHPNPISRGDLAERAGVSVNSSGFEKNLSTLRSLGLIDYGPNKTVFATELLFPFD